MPVFAIALPRFKQRYAYINRHLAERLGGGYETVGVYGADVAAASVADPRLSPGQVGCALSHLAVYKLMADRDIPSAFIVEDDAVLPSNILQIIEQLAPYLCESGVIQLHNLGNGAEYSNQKTVAIPGRMVLCYPMRGSDLGASSAYVIGSVAAKGILAANFPVQVTADNWQYFFEHGAFETARVLHPSPISVKPFETTVLPTTYKNAWLNKVIGLSRRTILFLPLMARRKMVELDKRRKVRWRDQPSEFLPPRRAAPPQRTSSNSPVTSTRTVS